MRAKYRVIGHGEEYNIESYGALSGLSAFKWVGHKVPPTSFFPLGRHIRSSKYRGFRLMRRMNDSQISVPSLGQDDEQCRMGLGRD
jgi:hypothetical protein